MNKYKVGDRVWYKGFKLTVLDECETGYLLFKRQYLILGDEYGKKAHITDLCVDLKPIITCK